ncbi:Reverse transcriptase, RNA-dependent DNA polymerase [Gossypium australe]|uniref:Reverse transcriptase, RNA-dependent DNA polymerase n=1 Tax=Gossypium australe TaxID=47621 RepID=A0A5B6VV43_9ROSI|nr:Reverse transcriptase, RNA-dependent DNA polymerase [Gossypium australe]
MITRSKAGIFEPKAYMSTATCLSTKTPADIHEAMRHEFWKAAIHSELQAFFHNITWSLCSLPINQRAIGCKWLFKVKKKADGTMERYKAQLVAKSYLLLMAYVDYIVITGNSNEDIDNVMLQLQNKFALKDMGRLNFFLGIVVQHTPQGLLLSQKKYIMEILHKTGMIGASSTPTPMVSIPKLVASDGSPPFVDSHLYRSVVGML